MKNKFENYTVAYIDFLGTKEKINTNDIECLKTIEKIFKETNDLFKKNSKFIHNSIKTKIFSDNILMFSKGINGLFDVATYSAVFQIRALINGLIVRGGISFGSFYESKTFVFGKALCDAVVLEEEIAVFPRIILDKKINDEELKKYVCVKDSDGYYYIDFYSYYPTVEFNTDTNDMCKKLKKQIIDLKSKNNNVKYIQKYDWLINYHNKYCEKSK